MHERARSEAWFETLLEAAPDAIVVTDGGGRIVLVNAQAERMFGYDRTELLGASVERLLPEGMRDEHTRHRALYDASPRVRPMGTGRDLVCRRRDGSELPVAISLSPLRTAQGLVVISVVRDVTEAHKAEEERRRLLVHAEEARAAAEAASRSKDQLLALVSHELRAPLQAILGWTEHLREEGIDRELLDHALDTIEHSVKTQTRLVADLLDAARIAAGKFRLEVQPLALARVVRAAVETVRATANAKGIRLETTLAPASVLGDADRLQQVVWNLLSNAVKFTPDGGCVQVVVTTVRDRARLIVRDTGRGIDRDFLPHVFERFAQADQPTIRSHGGLGVGLDIVRHIIEQHGGCVLAESDGAGHGATFIVELPRLRTRPARPSTRSHACTPDDRSA